VSFQLLENSEDIAEFNRSEEKLEASLAAKIIEALEA